jgi:hypothetical protein
MTFAELLNTIKIAETNGWFSWIKNSGTAIVVGIVIGASAGWFYGPHQTVVVPGEVPPAQVVKVQEKGETQYVVVPNKQGEEGTVTRIVQKAGKYFVVINDKEFEVPMENGQPQVGTDNGSVKVTTNSTGKLDISNVVNEQVRLAIKVKEAELKAKYEKPSYIVAPSVDLKSVLVGGDYKHIGVYQVFGDYNKTFLGYTNKF